VHEDDRDRVHEANQACVADPGKQYSIEYRVVRPDGVERMVDARAKVHFDENHKPLNIVGTVQDITEIKHAQNALDKAFQEIKQLKEQLEAENIYLRQEIDSHEGFGNIVGISNAIKYVIHRIRQVSCTKTTVLFLGETGTGKSIFAHALHEASDRQNKTFVKVNCASLPPNLIESELFGREKGAYTGSTARQIGRFELANGGTIFLDEIGELPLDLQAKLLKVIEEGEFERLGSPRSYKCDARIIASTNRDLEEEIQKGRFRKDLFYRLNVFPITIPPLRQRREDIAPLAKFFVEKFNRGLGKNISRISAGTLQKMEDYEWQGNVRELMNVIERAVILSEGPQLEVALSLDSKTISSAGDQGRTSPKAAVSKELLDVEREHIRTTLEESGWRLEGPKGAARKLAMNPSTLRARMKKLSIKRP
jgi:formate hydrogenlyase transcriptional activator